MWLKLCVGLALLGIGSAAAQQRPATPRTPAPPALRNGEIPAADAPGARDAASLPRYAGAILLEAKSSAFDEIRLPNAKLERVGDQHDSRNNAKFLPPAPVAVEGRLSRLAYLLPPGRSALEVVRNYQQVVKDAGGQTLFECSRDECGGSLSGSASTGGNSTGVVHMLYPVEMVGGPWTSCMLSEDMANQRYTLLDLANGGGKAAVLVWNVGDVSAGSSCKAWSGRLVALVVAVETARREQRMETVSAAKLGEGLARDGRVALYSLLFDTGRAEIKPESQPQLAELVSHLKADAGLRALIVGHTDNQGALDYNLDLSRRRAQAVVAALIGQGIPGGRLVPQGVGMASPLASNETDEGRAKNRRVELVRQ